MKKNLRIVSAAAAALLAVAPVAASATVANADPISANWGTNVPTVNPGTTESTDTTHAGTEADPYVLTFKTDANIKEGDSVSSIDGSWILKNIKTYVDGDLKGSLAGANPSNVKVYTKNSDGSNTAATSFKAGTTYYISATVAVSGLSDGKYYKLSESATEKHQAQNGVLQEITIEIPVTAYDPNAEGQPYFSGRYGYVVSSPTQNNVYQISGKALNLNPDSDGNVTVGQVLQAAQRTASFHKDIKDVDGTDQFGDTDQVIASLKKANITVHGKGASATFALPKKGFSITLSDKNATNHKEAKLVVEFAGTSEKRENKPYFWVTVDNGSYMPEEDGYTPNYEIKEGQNFNPIRFRNSAGQVVEFVATQTKDNNDKLVPSVITNEVDTHTPGLYNVKLSASNVNGEKSEFSYRVIVVASGKKVLYANGDSNVKTYSVYSNVATENPYKTFKNLAQVFTGSEKTVDGVSYTQVSTVSEAAAKNSSVYVKTSSLSKAEAEGSQRLYNKKYTKVYNEKGEAQNDGKIIGWALGSGHNLSEKTHTINGNKYYKVLDGMYKGMFVRVENFSSSKNAAKKTVRVRSRVYKSNGKLAKKHGKSIYVKKGAVVTIHGSKGRFYNIGGGKYLLKRNF